MMADANKFAKANPQSKGVLWFGYSGHGTSVLKKFGENTGSEEDDHDEAICPVDFRKLPRNDGFIKDNDLHKNIVKKLPHNFEMMAICDACHSGTMFDLPYDYEEDTMNPQNSIKQRSMHDPDDEKTPGKFVYLSGCKDDQTSKDLTWRNADGTF